MNVSTVTFAPQVPLSDRAEKRRSIRLTDAAVIGEMASVQKELESAVTKLGESARVVQDQAKKIEELETVMTSQAAKIMLLEKALQEASLVQQRNAAAQAENEKNLRARIAGLENQIYQFGENVRQIEADEKVVHNTDPGVVAYGTYIGVPVDPTFTKPFVGTRKFFETIKLAAAAVKK